MNKKIFYLLFFMFSILNCKTHLMPIKERKKCINTINTNLNLTKKMQHFLFTDDLIVESVCLSIQNKNFKQKVLKRRIDSFYLGNYTENEFLFILKIDRGVNFNFEFDRNKKVKNPLKVKSIEEINEIMEKIKKDTLNIQKINLQH